uniref:Uncharacterized protein n=1 Tax=Catharus ustulatus TaxID=91951 RepID=A0A8C3TT50_CATUS
MTCWLSTQSRSSEHSSQLEPCSPSRQVLSKTINFEDSTSVQCVPSAPQMQRTICKTLISCLISLRHQMSTLRYLFLPFLELEISTFPPSKAQILSIPISIVTPHLAQVRKNSELSIKVPEGLNGAHTQNRSNCIIS